jgi:hypothetical protein
MRIPMYLAAAVATLSFAACDGDKDPAPQDPDAAPGVDAPLSDAPPAQITMSFFITSTGNVNAAGNPMGADFRRPGTNDTDGLAGADEFCRKLAAAADPALANKAWRAYLSTSTVNAKDRIGKGPWYNQKLVKIADSVADLLDPTTGAAGKNKLDGVTGLDETGVAVPLNRHDIITGTLANGMAAASTCNNWTDNTPAPNNVAKATTGHYNRAGGGAAPTSWSSAHDTTGCTLELFNGSGGRGSIYCFVAN